MQQLSNQPNRYLNALKTLASFSRRFVIACLCAEKCRICGNEIALAIRAPLSPGALSEKAAESAGEANTEVRRKRYAGVLSTYGAKTEKRKRAEYHPPCTDGQAPIAVARAENEFDGKNLIVSQGKGKADDEGTENFAVQKVSPIISISAHIARMLANEIATVSLSLTHSPQVLPAFMYFAKEPAIKPRLSDCLCHTCWEDIKIDTPNVSLCQLSSTFQQSLPIASGVTYHGKIKDLIRMFKYDGDTTLAADLATIMSLGWFALKNHTPVGGLLIVPVPLHTSRQRARGFNQAELLAKELGQTLSIKVSVKALRRVKATRPQQVLGREERLKNVHGAFVGKRNLLAGKTILLVDDVFTSGSTLIACAQEVLECGASNVVALTAARAMLALES